MPSAWDKCICIVRLPWKRGEKESEGISMDSWNTGLVWVRV